MSSQRKVRNHENRQEKEVCNIFIAAIAVCGVITVRTFLSNTSAERFPDRYDGSAAVCQSSVDRNGDGIDDETDILQ